MPFYDISVPLSSRLPVYPGDPPVAVTPVMQLAQGDLANVSHLHLSSHSGTHLDAPRHFFVDGAAIDDIDPQTLLGPARICHLDQSTPITLDDLHSLDLKGCQRVLFKTTNSALWERPGFQSEYVALTPEAAQLLVTWGVQLVGIDYLSVDAFSAEDFPVHRTLLSANVLILEGLNLREVPPGLYELLVLPLLLPAGDGAPARAILRY